MGEHRWKNLSDSQQEILRESVGVWEAALESQLHAAEIAGDAVGRSNGVVYTTPPAADVTRFLASYDLYAARSAEALRRFDLDGMPTYRYARVLVAHNARHGKMDCNGEAE
jgi:TRAP-type C4-dicarboxylate transport system substrate-binding protein